MKKFFRSLKTTLWILLVLVCLFFIGSYLMPVHREIFTGMNDDVLFHWVRDTAVDHLQVTWWLFAAVAALALLTVNTLVCSLQAVRGRWTRRDFLLRIAPQIMHLGFLFILLAHLISAGWGYKVSGVLPEGSYAAIPEGRTLQLGRILMQTDTHGYPTGWSAEVSLFEKNQFVKSGILGPNAPLFYRGTGIYLKSLDFDQGRAAVLLVARDPGAVWALMGGILFLIGSIMLLVLKWKRA